MESFGPSSSTSEMEGPTDVASKDAQWVSRIAEEILTSLLQKAGGKKAFGVMGSAPSTSEIEKEVHGTAKDAQPAADRIAAEMVRLADHRRFRGTPPPKEQNVTIYTVPSRLRALHQKDFKRDDMFLGLFIKQEKFFWYHDEAFRLKLEVVDAFIAILNRQGGLNVPETVAISPANAVDVGLADAPRDSNVVDILEVETKGVHKSSQNVNGGKNKRTTPPPKDSKNSDLKVGISPGGVAHSGGIIRWDWDRLKYSVVEHAGTAQSHYAPSSYTVKNLREVRSYLALDSVFLCMFLLVYLVQRKSSRSLGSIHLHSALHSQDFDMIFERTPSSINRILVDAAKLQNQIPLYLIEQVLKILHRNAPTLVEDDLKAICKSWIKFHHESLPGYEKRDAESLSNDLKSVEHLLACLCHLTQGNSLTARTQPLRFGHKIKDRMSFGHEIKDRMSKWFGKILRDSIQEDGEDMTDVSLPSASKMKERGIHFQGHAKGTRNLVPELKHGFLNLSATLYIPRVSVLSNTETLWRNMLVYLYESGTAKAITDRAQFIFFLMFMDNLIDTEEDVEVLREGPSPVIHKSLLGNNQQVAELFNTIISHQVVGRDTYTESNEWRDLLLQIDQFLKQKNRIRFLEFLHDNFGTPVLIVSVIAGLIIFVLSVLQTIYSALQYYSS